MTPPEQAVGLVEPPSHVRIGVRTEHGGPASTGAAWEICAVLQPIAPVPLRAQIKSGKACARATRSVETGRFIARHSSHLRPART